jgi:adenylate kinase
MEKLKEQERDLLD